MAIAEGGEVPSTGRLSMAPESLELFAGSLGADDQVALEVSGNAWEVARIIRPHVARVVVASPADTGIRGARAKTDRLDARALAKLLATGSLDSVWVPDEATRAMRRRLGRRSQLVRVRTKAKNEIHGALMRRLIEAPKVSDLFGVKGRRWLEAVELPVCERETVDGCLRQIDFCEAEIARVEQAIAAEALASPEIRRLMTVPGVNVITAASFKAAIGEIGRFADRRKLVAYLGLDPKVRQSGASAPARGGSPSRVPPRRAMRWSRPRGRRSEPGDRSAPSMSGSAPAAATRSRSPPPPASWPACSGACSAAARTTPTASRALPARSSAGWS